MSNHDPEIATNNLGPEVAMVKMAGEFAIPADLNSMDHGRLSSGMMGAIKNAFDQHAK